MKKLSSSFLLLLSDRDFSANVLYKNSTSEDALWQPVIYERFALSRQYLCDGVVVRASVWLSVDLGYISLIESYQKTFKKGIHSLPASRSAFRGSCGEQADKFACCVVGQGTKRDAFTFMRKTGGPVFVPKGWLVAGRASYHKNKNAMLQKCRFLLWRPLIGK